MDRVLDQLKHSHRQKAQTLEASYLASLGSLSLSLITDQLGRYRNAMKPRPPGHGKLASNGAIRKGRLHEPNTTSTSLKRGQQENGGRAAQELLFLGTMIERWTSSNA